MSARIDLSLSENEFLALTYREFDLLWDRWRLRKWEREYLLATVASAVYACGFSTPKEPVTPDMLVFTTRPGVAAPARRTMSRADIAAAFRAIAGVAP